MHSHVMPAVLLAGLCGLSCAAAAQSSGMDLVAPQQAEPQQLAVAMMAQPPSAVDATRDCAAASLVLARSTVAHQRAGDPVEQARADFDELRSDNSGAWLFVLETVDSIYADPKLIRQALRDGRWLDLCRQHLGARPD